NNNAATSNIIEKLEKVDVDFLAAFLGSNKNKEQFIHDETGVYPEMNDWILENETYEAIVSELKEANTTLDEMLQYQRKQAKLKQALIEVKAEFAYFQDYKQDLKELDMNLRCFQKMDADKYLQLLIDIDHTEGKFSVKKKIQYFFTYDMYAFNKSNHLQGDITTYLLDRFFNLKITDLKLKLYSLK